jgi:hypothetical protein
MKRALACFALAALSAMYGRRPRAHRASARTVATAMRSTQWGSQAVGPPRMYSVRSMARRSLPGAGARFEAVHEPVSGRVDSPEVVEDERCDGGVARVDRVVVVRLDAREPTAPR